MTRRVQLSAGVLAAVVLAVLAVTAPPAAATDAAELTQTVDDLVVGSEHTDFGTGGEASPQELTNLSVVGSGDSATVELTGGTLFSDGFESGSLDSEWTYSTSEFSVTSSTAKSGAYSLEHDSSTGANFMGRGNVSGDVVVEGWVRTFQSGDKPTYPGLGIGIKSADTGYRGLLDWNNNEITIARQDSGSGNTLNSTSVILSSDVWYYLTFERQGDQLIATVYDGNPDNGGTELATVSTTDTTYTSGSVGVSGGRSGRWDDITATNASPDSARDDITATNASPDSARYVSANHDVTDGQQAAINITQLSNVSVTATVQTDGGTTLNQTTLTTTGNHTLNLSSTSSESLETILDISVTDENPELVMGDESILFTNHKPSASNFSPQDGATLTDNTVEFSVDVNDTEFPTAQGEEVTAELFVDGSSVGSKTVTSNQTVTITESFTEGGNSTYYWELSDSYGAVTTTAERTIQSPSDLYIRSETDPGNLVTSAQVNITYYYGDELLRANTSDGTVDLTGLPIDEPIIALAEADGYHTRTAVITSVYEQDSLYLLNNSLDSYQLIFDLSDPTGAYPRSQTILEVQRDIKLNGTTEWRTVAGDVFGAQGVTTDLQAGERYRLIIRNLESGDRSTLGSFTPTASQQITLEPESATVDISLEDNTSIGYGATRSSNGESIIVEYADPNQTTDTLTFMIHERFNESNVLLQNQSFSDLGNISYSEPLNATEQNQSWVVDFYWTKTNGESSDTSVVVGQGPRNGLIPVALDDVYRVSIGVAVLLITALLFSQLNVGVGAITTSLVGALLWYLGFLTGVTTGPAIVLAIGASGLIYYNNGGGVS